MNKGILIVLSSPSGGGKTTLKNMILERMENVEYSVSATTRPKRLSETDKDYEFMTDEEFKSRQQEGYFAETARVHGYMYGTPKKNIDKALQKGRDIIMDIDIQGALSIMKMYANAVSIFIMATSMDILKQRLEKRGTDSSEVIEKRMNNALEEMKNKDKFDYIVVNTDIEESFNEIRNIILEEKNKN